MSGRLAVVANAFLFGVLVTFGWLHATQPGVYYAIVQEDQALEWSSFWAFLLAAVVFGIAARLRRQASGALPWFTAGLALFCLLVAMEEISWGQRMFGHRPPDYFLAENSQQELNVHNIVDTSLRMWIFRIIILGYGVLLPLIELLRPGKRVLDRLGIEAPPIELSPAMFALYWVHRHYHWTFAAEVVECALGFGFLFGAMVSAKRASRSRRKAGPAVAIGLPALVIALGFTTAAWSQSRRNHDPGKLRHAAQEIEALKKDFAAGAAARGEEAFTSCDVHSRLYTLVDEDPDYAELLTSGAFANLVEAGMPPARAAFFLDPWDSPYWIRDRCDEASGRRVIIIYSFGPNRRRDSSRWELIGDDVGQYLIREPSPHPTRYQ